jgi:hypothetical protein
MDNSSFFSSFLGVDLIGFPLNETVHDFILISAQCIVIVLTDFLQIAVIVSVPEKMNFFRSGSKDNS